MVEQTKVDYCKRHENSEIKIGDVIKVRYLDSPAENYRVCLIDFDEVCLINEEGWAFAPPVVVEDIYCITKSELSASILCPEEFEIIN